MEEVESWRGGKFGIPHVKLVPIEEFKLSIMKLFIHVGFRDGDVNEVEQYEIGYVDEEE